MNTVVQQVRIPTPREFGAAWTGFFVTVAAIAACRSREYGPARFDMLAYTAASTIGRAAEHPNALSDVAAMLEDEHEKVALGILFEELLYIIARYRIAFELSGMSVPEEIETLEIPEEYIDEEGDPFSKEAVDDVSTVVGSIPKLMSKLPGWLRKAIDVILEALKLTRGHID